MRKIRTMTERFIDAKRPFVIAEIALAHDGSLGMAHAFVDAAAQAGADAVKFQTHIATAKFHFRRAISYCVFTAGPQAL